MTAPAKCTWHDIKKRDNAKLRTLERVEQMRSIDKAEVKSHGTRVRYMLGCKCMLCRAANSRYQTGRELAKKAGDANPIVPAERARQHILALRRAGLGRRSIADASDVGATIISEVAAGSRINIRRLTERRILDVDVAAALDGAHVDARQAWRQIRELLREGFTKGELAKRLGYKSPALQFRAGYMTAANVMKVDRFYRQIMAEGEEKSDETCEDLREWFKETFRPT